MTTASTNTIIDTTTTITVDSTGTKTAAAHCMIFTGTVTSEASADTTTPATAKSITTTERHFLSKTRDASISTATLSTIYNTRARVASFTGTVIEPL
jgi:hypothetical protein